MNRRQQLKSEVELLLLDVLPRALCDETTDFLDFDFADMTVIVRRNCDQPVCDLVKFDGWTETWTTRFICYAVPVDGFILTSDGVFLINEKLFRLTDEGWSYIEEPPPNSVNRLETNGQDVFCFNGRTLLRLDGSQWILQDSLERFRVQNILNPRSTESLLVLKCDNFTLLCDRHEETHRKVCNFRTPYDLGAPPRHCTLHKGFVFMFDVPKSRFVAVNAHHGQRIELVNPSDLADILSPESSYVFWSNHKYVFLVCITPQRYDPDTNTWTELPKLPYCEAECTIVDAITT